MKRRFSVLAEADIAVIYADLLTRYNLEAAERILPKIEAALVHLENHPLMGPRPTWGTRHAGLRFWSIPQTPFLLFYEPSGTELLVLRVLDGRRDVRRILKEGLENPEPEDE
jgi:plasmid stabilization system protein ParE